MRTPVKQRGLGSIEWLFVLAIGGFLLLCLFTVAPAYIDDYFMEGALKNMASKGSALREMDKGQLKRSLGKSFTLNNIRGEAAESIVIKPKEGGYLVISEYQVRKPLLANIEVVMSFRHMLDTTAPEKCCLYDPKKHEKE